MDFIMNTCSDMSHEDIREMASRWIPDHRVRQRLKIHTDTTDFFRVEYNDVVMLGGSPYLIRHSAKVKFDFYDEIKHWVKRAINLTTGNTVIIKLVFHENFATDIAGIPFECFRSPRKEARILKLVAGHKNFMNGSSIEDEKGNVVRILDFIYGKTLPEYVESMKTDHQTYFHDQLPGILDNFTECVEGIRFLHENGEKHGDIVRNHILIDRESNNICRWIDFDINYRHRENIYGYDLFGLGNILIFLTGKGDTLLPYLKSQNHPALSSLRAEDMNIVYHNRVANLKKIYPYIPESLNRVLLHFSEGTRWFYESTGELLEDLQEARRDL